MNAKTLRIQEWNVLRHITHELHAKLKPIGYARSTGVKLGETMHFYGMPSGKLGTTNNG
jgi:hypothetical protein